MSTVYLAANFINPISWVLNAGHLQFAYENNGEWTEIEVQMPNSYALGDWDFYVDGTRSHGGLDEFNNSNTPGVELDGSYLNPDRYTRVALELNEGQTAEQLWQLIENVGSAFAGVGERLNYDLAQNSNSFVTTVLETLGYSYQDIIASATPQDVWLFPGGGVNIFQDGGNIWLGSDWSLFTTLLDDATFSLIVEGSDGNDVLVGGRGADVIGGGAGDDTITVGLSNDVVRPGTGNNTIYLDGGFSNTVILLGNAEDYVITHPEITYFIYTNIVTGDATTIHHSNEMNNQRVIFGGDTDECFPAKTPIQMWAGGEKFIEDILVSDLVLSHDADGNAVAGVVDKLFTNTTSEFAVLSFADGRDDLISTLGHRYQTETGDYMEIGQMLRLGGGTARLVDVTGMSVEATGEIIAHSAETADMFAQAQSRSIAIAGNTALKEETEAGWQTYNFEVRAHHNYVADGIRVHNDSILSTLQEGDQLVALNDDLTDAAVLRDVDGDGTADFVTLDGYRRNGEATEIALERVYYWGAANGDLAGLIEAQLGTSYTDAGLVASNIFDPGLGSNWGDYSVNGLPVDDIEELFFDDILNASATGTDRAVIDGLYSATFFADVDIAALIATGNVAGSTALIEAISDVAQTPEEAVDIMAWALGYDLGSVAYLGMIVALGSAFDNVINTVEGNSDDNALTGTQYVDEISGDDGDDILYGLAEDDILQGGDGSDTLVGGGGADVLEGGQGEDFASYTTSDARVILDLLDVVSADGDAIGDTFASIEGVIGSDYNDVIFGDNAANILIGGAGNDRLYGRGGGDTLDGGNGNDILLGNGVQDTMTGGNGADIFRFHSENDSHSGLNNRDVITDFETGVDRVDIANIDADTTTAGDQAFTFIGLTGSFTGTAGELRYTRSTAHNFTLVQADVDGDGIADMQIELDGLLTLSAGDFIL